MDAHAPPLQSLAMNLLGAKLKPFWHEKTHASSNLEIFMKIVLLIYFQISPELARSSTTSNIFQIQLERQRPDTSWVKHINMCNPKISCYIAFRKMVQAE